ncbi:MAG TPA: glucose-6-phosphate isomerase family protein [Candidatus Dormibacteraeota bacterium]|nr:glucose-6-phosphate isomerase family protein [Candidatus Dormibacteraeota bacterium]
MITFTHTKLIVSDQSGDVSLEPIVMSGLVLDIDQLRTLAPSHSVRRASELSVTPAPGPEGVDIDPEDPVAYEVFEWTTGAAPTDLLCAVTVLYAGPDPAQPFHTRGHFHRDPDGGEVVVGLQGNGRLDLLSRAGEVRQIALGTLIWAPVPPGWAHRVTNLGPAPLVFLSTCSVAVGHDYANLPKESWVAISERGDR